MVEPKRKLAAIVFTDIVGFTKLSGENEPAALKLLKTQRELLRPIVDDYGGCLLYTSPSPRDLSTSRMPSSA